jgi:hypothetical protein
MTHGGMYVTAEVGESVELPDSQGTTLGEHHFIECYRRVVPCDVGNSTACQEVEECERAFSFRTSHFALSGARIFGCLPAHTPDPISRREGEPRIRTPHSALYFLTTANFPGVGVSSLSEIW